MSAPVDVFLTVDTEVWPLHPGGWPKRPLTRSDSCSAEIEAYFLGTTAKGHYGLPYQLKMLREHGLRATFLVDPMFSFALGLSHLREVVKAIHYAGQSVGLHLHPEWLTDPRCEGMPEFRGPNLCDYPMPEQVSLLRAGWNRLIEAGAQPNPVFRAGNFGADETTLQALFEVGIRVDSSLNARKKYSFPRLLGRDSMQEPWHIDGVLEIPITRFRTGASKSTRHLSFLGATAWEIRALLTACERRGARCAMFVMHSNEFAHTERLWQRRPVQPRHIVTKRFESVCRFLEQHSGRFPTRLMADAIPGPAGTREKGSVIEVNGPQAYLRGPSQLLSRWL